VDHAGREVVSGRECDNEVVLEPGVVIVASRKLDDVRNRCENLGLRLAKRRQLGAARPHRECLRLQKIGADLEAPCRGVGERMMEDVQRSLVLAEDELKVIVVPGIGDSDRHQIRRSTPEEPDRDSIALARVELRAPSFVCGFEHLVIPSA
jgi:hypothetical protein